VQGAEHERCDAPEQPYQVDPQLRNERGATPIAIAMGTWCALLEKKAKQLEARLPLQSTMVQNPLRKYPGGFRDVQHRGVTDLAPELVGYYGRAVSGPEKPDHGVSWWAITFSVHQTRVIAGGQDVPSMELLSRQVMKVTIPGNTMPVGGAAPAVRRRAGRHAVRA